MDEDTESEIDISEDFDNSDDFDNMVERYKQIKSSSSKPTEVDSKNMTGEEFDDKIKLIRTELEKIIKWSQSQDKTYHDKPNKNEEKTIKKTLPKLYDLKNYLTQSPLYESKWLRLVNCKNLLLICQAWLLFHKSDMVNEMETIQDYIRQLDNEILRVGNWMQSQEKKNKKHKSEHLEICEKCRKLKI